MWFPPLYKEGDVCMVKFSDRARKYTSVRRIEECTIIEVMTSYGQDGVSKHQYKVRYNTEQRMNISYRHPSGEMAQMVVVQEKDIQQVRVDKSKGTKR